MNIARLVSILRYSVRLDPLIQFLEGVGDRQCITAAEVRSLLDTLSEFAEPMGVYLEGVVIAPELASQAAIATEESARKAQEIEQYQDELQRSMGDTLRLQHLVKRQATHIQELKADLADQTEIIEAQRQAISGAIAKGTALLELVAQLQTAESALLVFDSKQLFEQINHEPISTPDRENPLSLRLPLPRANGSNPPDGTLYG